MLTDWVAAKTLTGLSVLKCRPYELTTRSITTSSAKKGARQLVAEIDRTRGPVNQLQADDPIDGVEIRLRARCHNANGIPRRRVQPLSGWHVTRRMRALR